MDITMETTLEDFYSSGERIVPLIQKVLRGEGTIAEERFVIHKTSETLRTNVALMTFAGVREVEKVVDPRSALPGNSLVDDPNKCAVCGWPLCFDSGSGCVRGKCSREPVQKMYSPERARREAELMNASSAAGIRGSVVVDRISQLKTGQIRHFAWNINGVTLCLEKTVDGDVLLRVVRDNPNLQRLEGV